MAEAAGAGIHAPSMEWMEWTRLNCPQTNWLYTDIDGLIRSKCGKVMIVELKAFMQKMPTHQKVSYSILDFMFKHMDGQKIPISINGYKTHTTLSYQGFYLIQFERTTFEDGRVFINGIEKTEQQVINLLSFKSNENEN